MICDALQDPEFAARWADPTDLAFRPFATAALCLRCKSEGAPGQHREFYHELTVVNRAQLLTKLAGMPVAPGILRLIQRTQWKRFGRGHWLALFSAAADPKQRRTLGHLQRIAPCLVRQLGYLPAELWLPRVLDLLNGIRIGRERWQRLASALGDAPAHERAALRAIARKIDGRGALWDYIFLCIEGRARPLPVPAVAHNSKVLAPLTTAYAVATEGRRMYNCLGDLIDRAVAGNRLLFRGLGDTPLTAGLALTTAGWVPGGALGWDNQVLDPEIGRTARQELEFLASRLNTIAPDPGPNHPDRFVAACAERADAKFPTAQIDALTRALRDIRGKSLRPGQGAFAIFSTTTGGYIQFMSSLDGREYVCEIASHKFTPEYEKFLTERAVVQIERAGFVWPRERGNFVRWLPCSSPGACRTMAGFALECLSTIFRHRPLHAVGVKVHIPTDDGTEAAT